MDVVVMVVVPLAALWLRLYFRLRGQREDRQYLLAAARLPHGSRIVEQRGGGVSRMVTVGDVRASETGNG
ncbi:hypothetical protein AB0M43_37435 [Longispora sp. NPDC051575]|uniref:hypothetical protein n=1 Tax=Longispora sp. NPDC051575 TaxID=3154943 RepID=UPI003422B3C6